jgi:hypothetical protein
VHLLVTVPTNPVVQGELTLPTSCDPRASLPEARKSPFLMSSLIVHLFRSTNAKFSLYHTQQILLVLVGVTIIPPVWNNGTTMSKPCRLCRIDCTGFVGCITLAVQQLSWLLWYATAGHMLNFPCPCVTRHAMPLRCAQTTLLVLVCVTPQCLRSCATHDNWLLCHARTAA